MSDVSRPSPAEARAEARTAVVIPAAGRGVRLGPGAPKALRALNGTPMLIHAVRAMAASRAVSLVVVVAPPDGAGEVKSLLDAHALPERTDFLVVPGGAPPEGAGEVKPPRAAHALPGGTDFLGAPGGAPRQERVGPGRAALPPGFAIVLAHAAAPPLAPVAPVAAVIEAVGEGAPAV